MAVSKKCNPFGSVQWYACFSGNELQCPYSKFIHFHHPWNLMISILYRHLLFCSRWSESVDVCKSTLVKNQQCKWQPTQSTTTGGLPWLKKRPLYGGRCKRGGQEPVGCKRDEGGGRFGGKEKKRRRFSFFFFGKGYKKIWRVLVWICCDVELEYHS